MTLSDPKIYQALSSLYRFLLLNQEEIQIELLIQTEKRILASKFSQLTPEELIEVVEAWPEFKTQQQTILGGPSPQLSLFPFLEFPETMAVWADEDSDSYEELRKF